MFFALWMLFYKRFRSFSVDLFRIPGTWTADGGLVSIWQGQHACMIWHSFLFVSFFFNVCFIALLLFLFCFVTTYWEVARILPDCFSQGHCLCTVPAWLQANARETTLLWPCPQSHWVSFPRSSCWEEGRRAHRICQGPIVGREQVTLIAQKLSLLTVYVCFTETFVS